MVTTVMIILLFTSGWINPDDGFSCRETLDERIVLKNVFRITGSERHPVFTYYKPAVSDNQFIFSDPVANKINIHNKTGDFLKSWGQAGRGPGDVTSPYKVIARDDLIFVNDARNNRMHIFTEEGETKDWVQFLSIIFDFLVIEEKVYFISPHPSGNKRMIVHQYAINSGEHVNSYIDISDKKIYQEGYISSNHKSKIFVTNKLFGELYVLNMKEETTTIFDLTKSQDVNIFKTNSPASRVRNDLMTLNYTSIVEINALDDLVLIQHRRINSGDKYKYFIDIYDHDGNLITENINTDGQLLDTDKNLYLFFQDEKDYGDISICMYEMEF